MPNIFDYLEWRGDVPFSADPFNDVDGLVLAELAYTLFDGIVPEDGEKISLGQVREEFFRDHKRESLMKSEKHFDRAPLLMDGMMSGARFSGTKFSDYIDIVDTKSDMQMSAVTYSLSDGSLYIAFRGTDRSIVGWKEDLNMSYLPETGGQRKAIEYLERVGSREKGPIRVGGHSKGGNFAVYASAFAGSGVKDRIIQVYSHDGPGFRPEVLKSKEYAEILPKIISIIPDTSIIGLLLTSEVTHKVIESSAKGLEQHDALTWEVLRNDFVPAELSDIGVFLRDTQSDWLSKIDDLSRHEFVETLFSLFEATGMGTFGAMSESKLKSFEKIFSSAQDLPKDKQKQLMQIVAEFLRSGGQNVKSWYNRMRAEYETDGENELQ
jgi:hypothetical protein